MTISMEEYANGSTDERTALYRRREAEGVGISAMKPFSGGQLLDGKTSPFGKAMTRYQCIRYALDKPGVLTVLPGIRNMEEVQDLPGYFDAPPEEKDRAVLGTFTPQEAAGACVYCDHCQPCPAGLNVGPIDKHYDLEAAGDTMAAGLQYASVAVACTGCRRCCPVGLDIPLLLKAYNDAKIGGAWRLSSLEAIPKEKWPTACIGCGSCMGHCPQGFRIPEYMKEMAQMLEKKG